MRSEALALFAGKPYAGAPLTDLAAHLTNTCRARAIAGPEAGDHETERPWHHDVDGASSNGQPAGSAGGVRVAKECGGAAGLAYGARDQDSSPSCCGERDACSGAAALAQGSSGTRGGAGSGAGGAGWNRKTGHGTNAACGAGLAGVESAESADVHGARGGGGAGWCEEDAVRLVSELPQARTASVSCAHTRLAMACCCAAALQVALFKHCHAMQRDMSMPLCPRKST